MIANVIPLAAKTPIREMLSTSQQLQLKTLGTLEVSSTYTKLSVYSCTSITKELLQVLWVKINSQLGAGDRVHEGEALC